VKIFSRQDRSAGALEAIMQGILDKDFKESGEHGYT
jgi:hypothetical protein